MKHEWTIGQQVVTSFLVVAATTEMSCLRMSWMRTRPNCIIAVPRVRTPLGEPITSSPRPPGNNSRTCVAKSASVVCSTIGAERSRSWVVSTAWTIRLILLLA